MRKTWARDGRGGGGIPGGLWAEQRPAGHKRLGGSEWRMWIPLALRRGSWGPHQVGRLSWRVVRSCGHPVAEWVGSEASALARLQGRRPAGGLWVVSCQAIEEMPEPVSGVWLIQWSCGC